MATKTRKFGHRYPWDEWFGAGRFTLRRGEDYLYRTDTMIQQARNQACRRGVAISITVRCDGAEFTVIVKDS